MMKYLKLLFYPLLFLVIQFSVIFIFTLIFNANTTLEINTLEYNRQLSIFLSDYKLLITLVTAGILLPLIIKKIENPIGKPNNILILIMAGVSFSISYNLLLFSLNKIFDFTNLFDAVNTNIIINLICSGLIGPILEELIFRGIVYTNLKKITDIKKSTLITGLMFGLFHGNIIQFVYAFLFNIILTKSYDKDNNILSPIIIHMTANISATLLMLIINKLSIYLALLLAIIIIILFIFMYKLLKDEQNNNVNNC